MSSTTEDVTPDDAARRARAEERRSRVILHKARLGETEVDLDPIRGAAAISLAVRLSRHAWSISGRSMPTYTRSEVPIRWVRRTLP